MPPLPAKRFLLNNTLLSVAFLPPLPWFVSAADGFVPGRRHKVYVDAAENYQKQSWRNRCRIATASGAEDISFPVVHRHDGGPVPVTEVRIDYSDGWLKRFLRAVDSAYMSAPYYEHYRDGLFDVLSSGETSLWEYDMALVRHLSGRIGLDVDYVPVTQFVRPGEEGWNDLRSAIHPKKRGFPLPGGFTEKPYWQVFAPRYGFIPSLSIIDLLFNEGPDSLDYLISSENRF
mgnify:CR=1 FL=1